MDRSPPSPAHSRANLAAVLDRVDAELGGPEPDWPDRLAALGMWGSWLRWILQLLAFQFALAGDEPGQLPAADTGAARPLRGQSLDRKIARLIKATAHLWDPDRDASARPRRPRWRRLLQLVLRWLGYPHSRFRPARVRIYRFRSAPVLALCKP